MRVSQSKLMRNDRQIAPSNELRQEIALNWSNYVGTESTHTSVIHGSTLVSKIIDENK